METNTFFQKCMAGWSNIQNVWIDQRAVSTHHIDATTCTLQSMAWKFFFYEKCHHWKIISSETETQFCNHGHTSTWISFELYCTVLQSSKQIQNTLFKIVIQRKHHFPQPFLLFRRPTSKNGLKKGHFRPFLLAALRKKCYKELDTSWSNEQVLKK